MNINSQKALKSGGWYTASNFLLGSLTFITTPIFARLMAKSDFGAFQNYLSWLHIFEIVATFNLNTSLVSGKYDYGKTFDRFIFSILALGTLSICLWLFIVLIRVDNVEQWLGFGSKYLCWMFGYILFSFVIKTYQTREQLLYRYKTSVAMSLGVAISTVILSLTLLFLFSDKVLARIVGQALPVMIFGLALFVLLGCRGKRIDCSCWRYALPISLPYIPHLMSMTMLNSMDKVMISNICGAEYTALYALAYTCGRAGGVFLTSLNSAFSPWLADQIMEGNYSAIRRLSYRYVAVFVVLIFGGMLLGPEVLLILGGLSYMEAIYALLPVMLGCLFQFLYTMYVNIEQIKKQTKGMAIASVSAALLNYVLNWLCIPQFGYFAAAYTTLVGYLWLLLVHMYLVKRMGYGEVYDYKFIAMVIGGMMLLAIGVSFLYQVPLLRWGVIIVYGSFVIYGIWKIRRIIKIQSSDEL